MAATVEWGPVVVAGRVASRMERGVWIQHQRSLEKSCSHTARQVKVAEVGTWITEERMGRLLCSSGADERLVAEGCGLFFEDIFEK
jgi:hypothetical protein